MSNMEGAGRGHAEETPSDECVREEEEGALCLCDSGIYKDTIHTALKKKEGQENQAEAKCVTRERKKEEAN